MSTVQEYAEYAAHRAPAAAAAARPAATRVVFCSYPSLYSSAVLSTLIDAAEIEVVGAVCSTRLYRKRPGLARNALAFARQSGWAYVAYHMLVTDVFHAVQPFAARKGVRQVCARRHIPVHETADINSADALQFLRAISPDLIVSAYFNQFVKQEVRELPRYGSINIHPSLLPRFRGADPVFHALLGRESDLGVTVHCMDDAFDTGSVLRQAVVPADDYGSLLDCYDALFERGAQLAVQAISDIRHGIPGLPQPSGGAYFGWPTRDGTEAFRGQGGRFATVRSFMNAISSRTETRKA